MEEGEWPFLGSGDKQGTSHGRERRHTEEGHAGRRNHLCKHMTCSARHKMMKRNGRESGI